MATTKKTAARPAARTTARKATATRKTATKKTATNKTAAAPVTETAKLDEVSDRIGETFDRSVKFARDAAHTSIGVGLVIQDRIARGDFMTSIDYAEFLDQAKSMGHDRVVDLRNQVEPYAQRITERFEPITNRIESALPQPVKSVVDAGRDRIRDLLAV